MTPDQHTVASFLKALSEPPSHNWLARYLKGGRTVEVSKLWTLFSCRVIGRSGELATQEAQQGEHGPLDDAIAAGDGTLHGAIDHWQNRALKAEADLAAAQPVLESTQDLLCQAMDVCRCVALTPDKNTLYNAANMCNRIDVYLQSAAIATAGGKEKGK